MDTAKRQTLIERIRLQGSIGCNLTPMLAPQSFFEKLMSVRSQPGVQDVLVEVNEVVEEDPATWLFADRVYVFANGTQEDVGRWTTTLKPDAIEKGFAYGKPDCAPNLKPGYNCYGVWWD